MNYADRVPPPDSPLGKYAKLVKERQDAFSDVRATFGDSLEVALNDDGTIEIKQTGYSENTRHVRLNYAEIVWLKKQLERITG